MRHLFLFFFALATWNATLCADPLTVRESKTIRECVYSTDIEYGSNDDGSELLNIPKELNSIYAKNPKGTLDILLKIVDGGNPKDSIVAASYSIALIDDPVVALIVSKSTKKELMMMQKRA